MKRRNSQIRNLSTLNPPLLNHSRKPIIFSSKFRNTILLTHLFLPDHFRMELGGEEGCDTMMLLHCRKNISWEAREGGGVFFLIRNTPNKGNWWFRGGKEKNNKNNRRRGVHNEIKSRGKKVSTLWRKVRNLEGWPAPPSSSSSSLFLVPPTLEPTGFRRSLARGQNEKWLLIGTLRNFSFEWTYKLRDTR